MQMLNSVPNVTKIGFTFLEIRTNEPTNKQTNKLCMVKTIISPAGCDNTQLNTDDVTGIDAAVQTETCSIIL